MIDYKKLSVCLCLPVGDKNDPEQARSVRNIDYRFLMGGGSFQTYDCIGQPIEVARNQITRDVLNLEVKPPTHFLWIDSDMVFPPDALKRLIDHDLPVVGGLCHNRRHPYQPILGRVADPKLGLKPGALSWMYEYPEGLVEVDVTGGAFLLVKREVYESILEMEVAPVEEAALRSGLDYDSNLRKMWAEWWTPNDDTKAEDFAFCRRAQKAGYKIMVDTSVEIFHKGEVSVGKAFAERNREFQHNAWRDIPERKKEQPVATIVIPTYNTPEHLLKGAIFSALCQTVPTEVIVVDDGSDEAVLVPGEFAEYLDGETFFVHRHEHNKGISEALNTGISRASTDWICWLSADDLIHPQKVEYQLDRLLKEHLYAGYHRYDYLLDNHHYFAHPVFRTWDTMWMQKSILASGCVINGSTTMIHKRVFDTVGLFDTSYRWSQDWEMWCRIGQEFLWYGDPRALGTRRENVGNLTPKIQKNPVLRDMHRQEDERILRQYKPVDLKEMLVKLVTARMDSPKHYEAVSQIATHLRERGIK